MNWNDFFWIENLIYSNSIGVEFWERISFPVVSDSVYDVTIEWRGFPWLSATFTAPREVTLFDATLATNSFPVFSFDAISFPWLDANSEVELTVVGRETRESPLR